MQITRAGKLKSIAALAGIYTIFLALGVSVFHDTADLQRKIVLAVGFTLFFGLIVWFGPRWKYFTGAAPIARAMGFGWLGISFWMDGSHLSSVVFAFLCVWEMYDLLREMIAKGRSLNSSQQPEHAAVGKG